MEANYQPIWSWLKEQNKVGNEIKDMQNLQTNKQTMEANCQPIWSWLKDQNKVQDMIFANITHATKKKEKFSQGS